MAMTSQAFVSLRVSSASLGVRCSASPQPASPAPSSVPSILQSARESTSAVRLALDPSAAYANLMWFRGPYNVQVDVEDNEAAEAVVRKFRRAVMEANVIGECQRRRFHEKTQDIVKRKQKERALARRRSRPFAGPRTFKNGEGRPGTATEAPHVDEDDYWGAKPDM